MVKFHCLRKCPGKKSVKSPIHVGISTNSLCVNVGSRQNKYHAFVPQIALVKEPNCPYERADSMPCIMRPAMLLFLSHRALCLCYL